MKTHLKTGWKVRGATLDLSKRPLVMGVLNVTPDSFSDGGLFLDPEEAVKQGLRMVDEGADIIDVGGESSRPGATPVPIEEELRRVVPVIDALTRAVDVHVSIDTYKSGVARAAIEAGASIINDISSLGLDPLIGEVAAETGAGLVLMHMKGTPKTMQVGPSYGDLLDDIRNHLMSAIELAGVMGVPDESMVVDPGIGFGKTMQHNWLILDHLDELAELGRPILIGTSRKRFLREKVGDDLSDLEAATVATNIVACLKGARIVRVHDVRAHRIAMDVLGSVSGG